VGVAMYVLGGGSRRGWVENCVGGWWVCGLMALLGLFFSEFCNAFIKGSWFGGSLISM